MSGRIEIYIQELPLVEYYWSCVTPDFEHIQKRVGHASHEMDSCLALIRKSNALASHLIEAVRRFLGVPHTKPSLRSINRFCELHLKELAEAVHIFYRCCMTLAKIDGTPGGTIRVVPYKKELIQLELRKNEAL